MSTNYYVQYNECLYCQQRPESLHIGKAVGDGYGPIWSSFEGHFTTSEDGTQLRWLTSWKEWHIYLYEVVITKAEAVIIDEYGLTVSLNQFVMLVEVTKKEQREKQFRAAQRNRRYLQLSDASRVLPNRDWLDEDGFSFYGGEFS